MRRLSSLAARWCAAALAAVLLLAPDPAGAADTETRPADLTLTGVMTRADHETYREVPFRVPAGVAGITVAFAYEGRDQRSVIDLGLRDPQRFRGWSGGNRARFTVSETWATPAYLPGPVPAGTWRLILGVPNLREGASAPYTARIWLHRQAPATFTDAPLAAGPGWFRGDLHMHSTHSDGACASRRGARIPCPLYRTLEAAAARGLQFAAVTEHNSTSHHQAMAELQPYFDDLLLIPGREITTFRGHANVFGVTSPLDFQLGSRRAADLAAILAQVEAAGGLVSINHPGMPSGELCMGCGWTAATDFARIPLIEAVNGGALDQTRGVDGPLSGIPFWEARLNDGYRITGVGGSDSHHADRDPARPGAVGAPTTVVWAEALSQPALLAGLRAGRVFVDLQGTRDRVLDVSARAQGRLAHMGQALVAPPGAEVRLQAHVLGAAGGRLAFAGPAAAGLSIGPELGGDDTRALTFISPGKGWLRVDVRGPDGRLWLLGNPIYLEPQAR